MLLPLVEFDEDNDDDDASSTRRQPLPLTVRLIGATPLRNQPLLSACRLMGAICWRKKEMPRTLVPLATMWALLALMPWMPLAYLLCNNQPFPIFRRGSAQIGQSPATTATVRNERSVSAEDDGGLGTAPQADRPLAARGALESGDAAAPMSSLSAAAARASTSALAALVLQRAPWLVQAGWLQANPPPLCLQQRPWTLMHDRADCRPWPLVWERANWLAH